MAKKSLKAKKPSARPRQSRADSLLVHAQAISELAAAIRQHAEAAASTRTGRAVLETVDTGIATGARLRPLSRADILAGIKAILNTTTALFVQNELGGGSARQQRNAAYLNHALATGRYPQLADLLAPASPAQMSPSEAVAEPADHYRDILARILSGLLGA